jgi:hypothetical protein
MPSFELLDYKNSKLKKDYTPVAIVKGDENHKDFNKFLCLTDKNTGHKSIKLPDDLIFNILPSTKRGKRDIFYIAGASGSGKSYQAKIICNNYHRLNPDLPIFLISKLEEDETLDELDYIHRVDIEDFIEEFNINNEDLAGFYIFDDFETLEKPILDKVIKIIDDICIMGRHKNITLGYISHNLTNYKKTRLILSESSHIVVFPQSSAPHPLGYLLKNYGGADKSEIKKLRKLGRWCAVFTNYPNYILSSNYAYLLHQDED